jgi:hypothetical protein
VGQVVDQALGDQGWCQSQRRGRTDAGKGDQTTPPVRLIRDRPRFNILIRVLAVRLGFRGSPTLLIDGHDPFASERDSVGLACRVYRTSEGKDGAPSVEDLRAALARWAVS